MKKLILACLLLGACNTQGESNSQYYSYIDLNNTFTLDELYPNFTCLPWQRGYIEVETNIPLRDGYETHLLINGIRMYNGSYFGLYTGLSYYPAIVSENRYRFMIAFANVPTATVGSNIVDSLLSGGQEFNLGLEFCKNGICSTGGQQYVRVVINYLDTDTSRACNNRTNNQYPDLGAY